MAGKEDALRAMAAGDGVDEGAIMMTRWATLVVLFMLYGACAQAQPYGNGPGGGPGAPPPAAIATGSTTLRTLASRAADIVNVKDFGAIGDDVADDTAAINAALTYWKSIAAGPINVPGAILSFEKAASYRITGPLNFTGLTRGPVYIEGNGAVIDCQNTGGSCIDALSSRWLNFQNLTVWGNPSHIPKIGIQLGRVSNVISADNSTYDNVFAWGSFSLTPIYNFGSESTIFKNLRTSNDQSGGYCLIQDGYNHFAVTSTFVSVTSPADTAVSFNSDEFWGADFRCSGNPAIWLGHTGGHSFYDSYIGNTYAGPAIVLFGEGGLQNVLLRAGIHIETTSVTDAFLVTGSDASQTIAGLNYEDFLFEGSNSVFKADVGVNAVALNDVSVRVLGYLGGSTTVFDTSNHAASIWTVSGQYHSNAITQFNAQGGGLSTGAIWQGPVQIGGSYSGTANYGYSTGTVQMQVSDNTVRGGNSRGANSVDLQTLRAAASQVASGGQSIIIGGNSNVSSGFGAITGGNANTATNTASIAFGQANNATGPFSFIGGGRNAADHGFIGKNCFSSMDFSVSGDGQTCFMTLLGTGSSASAIRLTSDNAAASAANCVNLPANTAYQINVRVMAFDHTAPANNESWGSWNGLMVRQTLASSTTVSMDSTPTPKSNGSVSGSSISATADTTNACLNLSFTPPTGNTDTWNVVAKVDTVEVQ